MSWYFNPIKSGKDLGELELDLQELYYTRWESGVDKRGNPLYRIFNGDQKVGIIVVMNQNLQINIVSNLERNAQ